MRRVFLRTLIDLDEAQRICAEMLKLDDGEGDISFFIDSPGGSVADGLAVYDTMQHVHCDVATICLGLAASMAQFLLCAGTPGKRYAFSDSRILLHEPIGQGEGIEELRQLMAERIAFHTGCEHIEERWFTAEEARDYGLIDQILGGKCAESRFC